MSLEAAINANTAAVEKLIAVTTDLLSLRTDALEKVGAAVTAGGKGKAKDKEETKANISTSPEDRKNPDETGTNPYEGIRKLISAYLTAGTRPEKREARKEKVKALLNHEKIKKPDVAADAKPDASNIMESAIPLFKEQIEKLTTKGDLTKPADDDLV